MNFQISGYDVGGGQLPACHLLGTGPEILNNFGEKSKHASKSPPLCTNKADFIRNRFRGKHRVSTPGS